MGNYPFKQLRFVRSSTMAQVREMGEEKACIVPPACNNNVLWNLGHILLVHEKFTFALINEKMGLPKHFAELFSPGTKPGSWGANIPSLDKTAFWNN